MWGYRLGFAAVLWASAAAAQAQMLPAPDSWTYGTELAVVTGAATGSSTTGAVVGGLAKWDLTRWVAVEGRASWFDRGVDATAFGADINGIVNLVAKRSVTPFVGAGFGLYHATFQSMNATIPEFYAARMPQAMVGSTASFTDPALRLTGGVDLISQAPRRHWTLRPEVSALIVFANGSSETIVSGTVSVGYRFRLSPRGN